MRRYPFTVSLSSLVLGAALWSFLARVDDETTIRWAHVYEASTPFHQQAIDVASRFEELTEGRYRIRVYPASALGNESAINEALSLGSIDIIYTGAAFAANAFAPLAVSDFPYAVESFAHWRAYRDSPLFREISDGFGEATGSTIAGLTYYGFRHVTANKPILHPRDMQDLKIRVPNSPIYLIMPEATGANATPMPFGEVYLALQQGVVDAQENPLTTIRSKRFYEVQSDISLTGHIMPALVTVVANELLAEMSDQDAQTLKELLWRGADRASRQIAESERTFLDWFRKRGLRIHEVDRGAFRAAVMRQVSREKLPFDPSYLKRLRELAQL
ncbi:MAG: sialic acid TRAP transporter substrate-binding protein SiaP [Pseudomonadota bacterium]